MNFEKTHVSICIYVDLVGVQPFGSRVTFILKDEPHFIKAKQARLIKNLPAPFGTLKGKKCV
jgi:hypothetical protein